MVVNSNLQEIKKIDCRRFLQRSKAGLFICPACRSGDKENRTGALQFFEDSNKFKCHACGTHGDVIDLYRLINGLDAKESIKALNGLITGHREPINGNKPLKEEIPAQAVDYSRHYKKALDAFKGSPAEEYINKRGISTLTALTYGLGYLRNIRFSATEKHDALLIPINESFYICRNIDNNGLIRYKNPKGGKISLFNDSVLADEETVFVCESVLDALSIIEIGGQAIGLNSVGNVNKLLKVLEDTKNKPSCLILCLDNDKGGEDGTQRLIAGLKSLKINHIDGRAILFNGFKDINEALQVSRIDLLNNFDKCLQKAVFIEDEDNGGSFETSPIKEEQNRDFKKTHFSVESFEKELENRDILIKHNLITHKIDFYKEGEQTDGDDLITILFSELYPLYKPLNLSILTDYIRFVSNKNSYNPVLELLKANRWDGADRFQDIYKALHIADNDQLSKVLIYKWFWQGIALLHNNIKTPFGADGILVLSGLQGIGKTTFFKHFAIRPEWFGGGRKIKAMDKDHERRCVTSWVIELGELDTTFKHSDAGALKEFITREVDVYRLPYGRLDKEYPRRSNIGATVNGHDFLIDETGNRRYWTVPVTRIELKELIKINPLQTWLQVYETAKKDLQGFRLVESEREQLEKLNKVHTKTIKGEDEVLDIIATAEEKGYLWQPMTISDFKEIHKEILRPYSVHQLTKVLDKIGIKSRWIRTGKKTSRARELPTLILNGVDEIEE